MTLEKEANLDPEDGEKAKEEALDHGSEISLFSPEGLLVLLTALIIDMLGIITLILTPIMGIGQVVSWIIDIGAAIIIGGWAFLRVGALPGSKSMRMLQGKLVRKIAIRLGVAFLIEAIPVVGDIMPSWTLFVTSILL